MVEKICGIYKLEWVHEPGLIYVGKSVNIHTRFRQHRETLLRNEHTNYLVQRVFQHIKTLPELSILEECSPEQLNDREIYWHNKLDSISNGLNIALPGQGSFGCDHSTAKYSKSRVLRAFSLLYSSNLNYSQIEKQTKVSIGIVSSIRNSTAHVWLKYVYPEQYAIMLNRPIIKGLPGLLNSNSRYPKNSILKCFSLLVNKPEMSQQAIADRVKVPRHLVVMIKNGSHLWLQEAYPEKYIVMINRRVVSCKNSGTSNPNSKYSRATILKCLCLLTNGKTNRQIADRINMDIAAVNKIKKKIQHKWLAVEFPYRYSKLPT